MSNNTSNAAAGDTEGFATYFGYGSLVNRKTRPADEPFQRATLTGWRRQWAHRANRPWQHDHTSRSGAGVSALSVEEHADSAIDGVLVPIARQDLPQLDAREEGYYRVELPASAFTVDEPLNVDTVIMYVSGDSQSGWANTDYPLIQSYVDCVIDGFHTLFGEAGVKRFLETTEHWTLPLYNDRLQPLYPRWIELTDEQRQQTDRWLSAYRPDRLNPDPGTSSP